MPVVGFRFKSFEAKRKNKETSGNINVNSAPRIVNITERDMPFGKAAAMEFEFRVTYDPDMAEVLLTGELLYNEKDLKPIFDLWKKDKKIPEANVVDIMNTIFRKCLIKASVIAEDLQLPPPIPMPRIESGGKDKSADYIG